MPGENRARDATGPQEEVGKMKSRVSPFAMVRKRLPLVVLLASLAALIVQIIGAFPHLVRPYPGEALMTRDTTTLALQSLTKMRISF